MEVTLVLHTESGNKIVCYIDLLIERDFQMEESHGRIYWREYVTNKEIISLRFEKDGYAYEPKSSELEMWNEEIQEAV